MRRSGGSGSERTVRIATSADRAGGVGGRAVALAPVHAPRQVQCMAWPPCPWCDGMGDPACIGPSCIGHGCTTCMSAISRPNQHASAKAKTRDPTGKRMQGNLPTRRRDRDAHRAACWHATAPGRPCGRFAHVHLREGQPDRPRPRTPKGSGDRRRRVPVRAPPAERRATSREPGPGPADDSSRRRSTATARREMGSTSPGFTRAAENPV